MLSYRLADSYPVVVCRAVVEHARLFKRCFTGEAMVSVLVWWEGFVGYFHIKNELNYFGNTRNDPIVKLF